MASKRRMERMSAAASRALSANAFLFGALFQLGGDLPRFLQM